MADLAAFRSDFHAKRTAMMGKNVSRCSESAVIANIVCRFTLAFRVCQRIHETQRLGIYNVVRLAWQVDVCAHAHNGAEKSREEGSTPPCPMRGSSTTERADSSSASRKPRAASTGDDGPISAILRASSKTLND